MVGGMLKKNDGFTLLEIVISIAAVSLISIVILRMFLAASGLNDRARDTDIAVNMSITELERLKSHESFEEYLAMDAPGDVIESGDSLTISFYYDKDWDILIYPGSSVPKAAKYSLKMVLRRAQAAYGFGGAANGELYAVAVDVTDMSPKDAERSLASFETKKYFPAGFEEGVR